MACRYTVDDVLSCIDVPMLDEEEDMSEDEFDGYLSEVSEDEDHEDEVTDGGDDLQEDAAGGGNIVDYIMQPGCTVDFDGLRPIDFFCMMVDEGMMDHIVAQTILYAQ